MNLQTGLSAEKEMMVTENDLASFAGNIGADVLSTHCIVLLMELAARKAIEGRIPEGKISLGTCVNIRHFSAALVGSRVRAVARLSSIKGHKLQFRVAAYDDTEKLAEGENEHVIVSRAFFNQKIASKKKTQHAKRPPNRFVKARLD